MRNSFSLFAKALLCLRSDFANKEKDFLKLKFEKISQTRHFHFFSDFQKVRKPGGLQYIQDWKLAKKKKAENWSSLRARSQISAVVNVEDQQKSKIFS